MQTLSKSGTLPTEVSLKQTSKLVLMLRRGKVSQIPKTLNPLGRELLASEAAVDSVKFPGKHGRYDVLKASETPPPQRKVNPVSFSIFLVLNSLVEKLDRRAKKAPKGVGHFLTKCRVDSADSTLPPPPDAPTWTLKQPGTLHSENPAPLDSATSSARQRDASLVDTPLSAGQPTHSSVRRQLLPGHDEDNRNNSSSESD